MTLERITEIVEEMKEIDAELEEMRQHGVSDPGYYDDLRRRYEALESELNALNKI